MRARSLWRATLALSIVLAVAPPLRPSATAYDVVGGRVVYEARTFLNSWKGTNTAVDGRIYVDWPAPRVGGRVCVQLDRWDSRNGVRDLHTRRMFETDRFPLACFFPSSLELLPDRAHLAGRLEIHGVTRSVQLEGRVSVDDTGLEFEGRFDTRITLWDMGVPSFAGLTVQDEVRVWVWLQARRAAP